MKKNRKNNDDIFLQKMAQFKIKCSHCGHTMYLVNRNYCICDWCGHKVYRSKKDEFEDKLSKEIKTRH